MENTASSSYRPAPTGVTTGIKRNDIRFTILFGVIVLASSSVGSVSCAVQSYWEIDESGSDVIYSVDALFTTKIDSVINCAELCSLHEGSCGRMHYTYDPAFGTCVRLYTIKKTWTMASDVCKNDGTHLLIADTITKTQASKNGVHSSTFLTAGRWWIGGYDYDESAANDFKWVNGDSIDTGSIWHPNEPSSHKERCVNLYPASASLNDLTCSIEEFFVCQEY